MAESPSAAVAAVAAANNELAQQMPQLSIADNPTPVTRRQRRRQRKRRRETPDGARAVPCPIPPEGPAAPKRPNIVRDPDPEREKGFSRKNLSSIFEYMTMEEDSPSRAKLILEANQKEQMIQEIDFLIQSNL